MSGGASSAIKAGASLAVGAKASYDSPLGELPRYIIHGDNNTNWNAATSFRGSGGLAGANNLLKPQKDEEGNEIKSYGSFHSTWRRHDDGTWRVVFDAGDRWPGGASDEELALLNAEDECGE